MTAAEGALRATRPEIVVSTLMSFPLLYARWNPFGISPTKTTDDDIAAYARTLLSGILATP